MDETKVKENDLKTDEIKDIKEIKPEDYSDLVEHFFNEDLKLDDITVLCFDEEKQFHFEGFIHKARKAVNDKLQFSKESIYEKLGFQECKKIANWLDENTNIRIKMGDGNYIDKVFKFLSISSKYIEIKEDIKKKYS